MGSSSSVRVISRRTHTERCVYCHDLVGGKDAPCARCGAWLHGDCRAQLTRCPTIGCAEPLLRTAVALRRPRVVHEPLTGGGSLREGAPPGPWARWGPYTRLLASAGVHLLFVLGLVGGLAAWGTWWLSSLGGEVRPAMLSGVGLAAGLAGLVGIVVASGSLLWLARLPKVWSEVGRLLDHSRPASMVLDVVSARDGEARPWVAQLRRAHDAPPVCALPLRGLLVPGWLRRPAGGQRVWVWGWPGSPRGPYLLELPDGRLALIHP